MSVLDTFYILFKTDAEKLADGTDKARKSGEGLAKDMQAVDKSSKDAGRNFLRMTAQAAAALGAVATVGSAISGTLAQLGRTEGLRLQAEAIDMNISMLDAYGKAFERQGSKAGVFASALQAITADAQNLSATGQSSMLPILGRLGVSMLDAGNKARSVAEMIPEIADALSGMEAGQALSLGRQLGFDDAAVRALMKGKGAVAALVKEQERLGTLTGEDAEIARQYAKVMLDLQRIMQKGAVSIASVLVPAVKAFTNAITNVTNHIRENAPFYDFFFQAIAGGVTAIALVVMSSYVPAMTAAAAATIAATWPALLLIGAFLAIAAAVALVYDDFQSFSSGGESLLGGLYEKWAGLTDSINNAYKAVRRFIGMETDDVTAKVLTEAEARIREADSSPLNSVSSSAISNYSRSSRGGMSVDKIEINTQATDAEGIAREIGRSLRDEYNHTIDQFDDGILA